MESESMGTVVVLDVETTGLDPEKDRIVQFSASRLEGGKMVDELTMLINPKYPISPEASAVHGYTNEKLKGKPTFRDVASNIQKFIGDGAIVGHNVLAFDLLMLIAEFSRVGLELDMRSRKVIDTLVLFREQLPHTLDGALRHYCGEEIVDAHDAAADVRATVSVLAEQLKSYSFEEAAKASMGDRATLDGKVVFDADGNTCLNFGKHTGTKLRDIPSGYRNWILAQTFSGEVKKMIRESLR